VNCQPAILDDIPQQARYLYYNLNTTASPRAALEKLARYAAGRDMVVGFGKSLLAQLGLDVPGMHDMPAFTGGNINVPNDSHALWCWLRGTDRGVLLHQVREVNAQLGEAFSLVRNIDAFKYDASRDLTGYEDGTENPQDQAAMDAALMQSEDPRFNGGSFVAVQQWLHDLDAFEAMDKAAQDNIVGRERISNEEMEDAPEAAHVKRTAQEDFSPEAFVLRRSMPWCGDNGEGLVFVAFGKSFYAFETLLRHMLGNDDGITDNLFRISKPVHGAYFWCPPVHNGILQF
jgi:putative iron-dependent peroxidase